MNEAPTPSPFSPPASPKVGLSTLHLVELTPAHQRLLEAARKHCGGPKAWQYRKLAEARDLLALAQISRRLIIHRLDLSADLRAEVELIAPVPVRPDPNGELHIAPRAYLGINYAQHALVSPTPGTQWVVVLAPWFVYHSNVLYGVPQVLCLGATLPAGYPLKDVCALTYNALTMKALSLDKMDPAGVLNPGAVDFFLRAPQYAPLTQEPFIPDLDPDPVINPEPNPE